MLVSTNLSIRVKYSEEQTYIAATWCWDLTTALLVCRISSSHSRAPLYLMVVYPRLRLMQRTTKKRMHMRHTPKMEKKMLSSKDDVSVVPALML